MTTEQPRGSRFLLVAIILAVSAFHAGALAADERWYDSRQVSKGEQVYRANCMVCHREAGAGTENWQRRDASGNLPPPPLNGTAHTWHHDLEVLSRTIREGGVNLGGTMPGFAGQLDENDIAAVIAYVQSLWPEQIYQTWAKAYPDDAELGIETTRDPGRNEKTMQLAQLLAPGTDIGTPEPTPIPGIYGVSAGSRYVFVDETGRYVFTGDLVDLQSRRNLGEQRQASMRLERLADETDVSRIVFPALGEQRAHLDVFTDTTCPYCRQLHREVPDLQSAGVSVRYLPFPREGREGRGYHELRAVWCATDGQAAMNQAKLEGSYPIADGDCAAADAVDAGHELGLEIGVSGTPAIILPDGRMIPGYQSHVRILEALGLR